MLPTRHHWKDFADHAAFARLYRPRGPKQGSPVWVSYSWNMNEQLNAMLASKLSYWDPIRSVDVGEVCATRRLLQLRAMGVSYCSVEKKIKKEAAGMYGARSTPDVIAFFKECLGLWESFASLNAKRQGSKQYWCVLPGWEVVDSAAKSEDDMGSLIFVDATATRFIATKQGNACCKFHTAERAAERANVFFCLATYLGFNPKWVRYFGFGGQHNSLEFPSTIMDDNAEAGDEAGFGQVDAKPGRWQHLPMLTKKEIEKIDNVIASSNSSIRSTKEEQDKHGGRDALYKKVLNANKGTMVPHLGARIIPQCTWCEATAEDKGIDVLLKCGQCKIAAYCSKACQRKHWKAAHKTLCKAQSAPGAT